MTLTPILDVPEATVYGPPDTVSIVSDLGPQGERGSYIYTNIGHPNAYTAETSGAYTFNGETLKLRDMYYRVDNDSWYQWLQTSSGKQWQLRSGIKTLFKLNESITFSAGVGSLTVPVTELWGDLDITGVTADRVCVTVTAVDDGVVFATIYSKTFSGGVPDELVLSFRAFNLNMGTALPYLTNDDVVLNIMISLTE